MIDYATHYPEAIPLQTTVQVIALEFKIFVTVGLPREILIDQGVNFTSRLMKVVCNLL